MRVMCGEFPVTDKQNNFVIYYLLTVFIKLIDLLLYTLINGTTNHSPNIFNTLQYRYI